MNDSAFDSSAFLSTQFETGFSTEYISVPDDEYVAVIRRPKDPTKPSIKVRKLEDGQHVLDLGWTITDDKAKVITGMEANFARQSCWMDLTPGGGLDKSKGKNVQFGQVLAAMGLNDGRPFSFDMLYDRPCKVRTKQRSGDDGRTYVDVKAVAGL